VTTPKDFVAGAKRVALASGRLLRSADRSENVKRLARSWTFLDESRTIPERFINDIFPGIERVSTPLPLAMKETWELPFGERAILDGIVRMLRPGTVFEFGTASGTTTVLLANAAPRGAVVHTVDLPEDAVPEVGVGGVVGREFRGKPEYEDVIVQHRADLRSFDVSAYRRSVDFVLIDAGHDYESVTQDSQLAFEMLRPGGCIVWDDYQPLHWGTVRALNDLSEHHRLTRIAFSRFVLFLDSFTETDI